MSRRYSDDERDVLAHAAEILLCAGRERERTVSQDVYVQVAGFLLAHPDAKANAVAAQVPARRQDVLLAVRELREARTRFLSSGNRVSAESADPSETADGNDRVSDVAGERKSGG